MSQENITIKDLAQSIASLVFDSQAPASLEPYSELLEKIEGKVSLSNDQKREILILNMLAAVRAVQNLSKEISNTEELLDQFHEAIYKKISSSENEQEKFEQLVQKRYQIYYKILASGNEKMGMYFGKQFADHFLGHESNHKALVLIVSSAEMFALTIESVEKTVREILSEFNLQE